MLKKGKFFLFTAILLIFFGIAAFVIFYLGNGIIKDVNEYVDRIYKIERDYIENFPAYEDYGTSEKEATLRQFLLMDHLKVAESKMDPLASDKEIDKLVNEKKLIAVEVGKDIPYYFYNVPKKYRYLTPETKKGLDMIAERFQATLRKKKDVPVVKIAVSSAIRPDSYQQKLREKNGNASFASSHSYGVSFDIFYEDYFVKLPDPDGTIYISRAIQDTLRTRFGFLMGDSLQRQFRSMLMETLIELQEEGKIYAILEKRQKCYHVTVLSAGSD